MANLEEDDFLAEKHVKYFKRILGVLPAAVSSLDTSRMTLLFFGLSGLDVLGALDKLKDEEKDEMVEWIYAQQILPDESDPDKNLHLCGFRGSGYMGAPADSTSKGGCVSPYDCSHITMTYTAMACLLILGDNLSRVNRAAVLQGVKQLQLEDGSFCSTALDTEHDMRFVFCACCICYMLSDWSAIDVERTVKFIKLSQGYDCGIGQGPRLESHGGSTFCAIASLVLMNRLNDAFTSAELEGLKRWCILRQQTGFQGRPNKPVDTCYSFWVGGSLKLLGVSDLVDKKWNRSYVMSTQGKFTGGFSKWPDCHPDPLHSYLGVCGLSMNGEAGLLPVHAALNLSQRAVDHLRRLNYSKT